MKLTASAEPCVEQLSALALIALNQRQWLAAEQHLRALVALAPEQAQHWYNLGYCYCCQGKNSEACQAFGQSFRLDGTNSSLEMLAQSRLLSGQLLAAAQDYLRLWQQQPESSLAVRGLVQALRQLTWAECPANLRQTLVPLLDQPGQVDLNALAALVAQAILASPLLPGSVPWLNQPLLLKALASMLLMSTELEQYLAEARRQILMQTLAQGQLSDEHEPFWQALIQQSWLNEYLYPLGPQEAAWVEQLEQAVLSQLAQADAVANDVTGLLCLLAAYCDLSLGPIGEWIQQQHWATWPPMLVWLIERQLQPAWHQQHLAVQIPCFNAIAEPTSSRVQAQYEAQPYPRWFALGAATPLWLGQRLQQVLPGYIPASEYFEPDLAVLIAGCGTGRHALRVAVEYRQSRVLALDLSRASLAYALAQAEKLAIKSVEFMQADILDLAAMARRFAVIESVGVLHHMADPMAGWSILRGLLAPQGLMQIGLYSRLARQSIEACRHWISQLALGNTAADIRRLRQVLMDPRMDDFAQIIRQSRDFYTLSGCRDLLFHECEHQFDLTQIAQQLTQLKLEFLGFTSLPAAVVQQYQQCYPQDSQRRNLNNWAEFERRYPGTFGRMYVFWCQAVA